MKLHTGSSHVEISLTLSVPPRQGENSETREVILRSLCAALIQIMVERIESTANADLRTILAEFDALFSKFGEAGDDIVEYIRNMRRALIDPNGSEGASKNKNDNLNVWKDFIDTLKIDEPGNPPAANYGNPEQPDIED